MGHRIISSSVCPTGVFMMCNVQKKMSEVWKGNQNQNKKRLRICRTFRSETLDSEGTQTIKRCTTARSLRSCILRSSLFRAIQTYCLREIHDDTGTNSTQETGLGKTLNGFSDFFKTRSNRVLLQPPKLHGQCAVYCIWN